MQGVSIRTKTLTEQVLDVQYDVDALKPIELAIFCQASSLRRAELDRAFQSMSQFYRVAFLFRLAWLWQKNDAASQTEIEECFLGTMSRHLGKPFKVTRHDHEGRHCLYIWVESTDRGVDVKGSQQTLLALIISKDRFSGRAVIDELESAANAF